MLARPVRNVGDTELKNLRYVAAATILGGAANTYAAVSDAEFEALKAQIAALAGRVAVLEDENASLRQISEETYGTLEKTESELALVRQQSLTTSVADSLSLKGDFRYRYEEIDVEDVDSRKRNRIRARAQLLAKLPRDVEVGLGVATGGDNPVSANQTLGSGNTSKGIFLDLAYATWQATDALSFTAGKYSNELYRPQKTGLLWDSDWRPEGISLGWRADHLFVNMLGNWLESDSKRGDDFAWGVQGGSSFSIGEASLTAAVGYYDFPTEGSDAYFDDNFFGNSSIDGVYAFNYEMIEVGADLGFEAFDLPVHLFGNAVQNQDADEFDTGWLLGANIGSAKGRGNWQVSYQYQDLEADAVLGLLSDSNFAGGGTDGKGHRIGGEYGLSNTWTVGFTWFLNNEAGEKNLADRGGAVNYDRIIIDTKFKY